MNKFDIKKIFDKFKNNPAIISKQKTLTYESLFNLILKFLDHYKSLKIEKGENIAILSNDPLNITISILSLISYGALAVPINRKLPEHTVSKMLNSMNCNKIFIDDNLNDSYHFEKIDKIPYPNINDIDSHKTKSIFIDLKQSATIIFTSGTSGTAKGAVHSLENHICNALGSKLNIPIKENNRWLLSLPLYSVGGIAILFRCLISGAAIVIPQNKKNLPLIVKKYQITHLSLVPTQLYQLIKGIKENSVLQSIKSILIGGDRISKKLFDKSIDLKLPIYLSYGSTEMSSQITTTSKIKTKQEIINSGKLLKYRNLKINTENEILVQGKTLFKGYYRDNKIINNTDVNGWFKTGDLGYFDKNNNLIVYGRKTNMFISGGENIYPEEIEKYLEEYPNIVQAIVIPIKNSEFGERPIAFIKVLNDSEIDDNKINNHLLDFLPKFKIPLYYINYQNVENDYKSKRSFLKEIASKYEENSIHDSRCY
jgi:o-succinylbenzoate---CoA ligase